MSKFLVTGFKGFIGSNLYETLISEGHEVYGIDEEYIDEKWDENLYEILNSQPFDAIFHVGACSNTLETNVNYMMLRNYETTKLISDFCKTFNIPLVYSSSAANYGTNKKYPSNLYGWSKYVAEDYVLTHGGIALRYFNVYGPGEEKKGPMSSVAYQSFIKAKNKQEIKLFPKNPQRDFVYIKDVIDANIFAYNNFNSLKGFYYEVGSGEARSFEDVMNFLNIPFSYTLENLIPNGYQFYTCSDNSIWMPKWEPKWSLQDGLNDYKKYLTQ
jgi:ADP-L-glycero-D-manno-heptose 6-epimerase